MKSYDAGDDARDELLGDGVVDGEQVSEGLLVHQLNTQKTINSLHLL